jgi:H+-translocating NAD(P) transhydrogenase subunit beta
MNINEFIPTGIQISYLVATALFFIGLKYLGSPATARQGNTIAAVGMLIAVIGTLLNAGVVNYQAIFLSIAIGSAIGVVGAYKVSMTEMPQMVGLLNGLGGGASTLIAVAEFLRGLPAAEVPSIDSRITLILSILIGGITLTGSLIAFAKLQELMSGSPITFPLQQPVNILLFASFVVGSAYFLTVPKDEVVFLGLTAISLILGVLFVLPIGGADMPVVVSLLNSFSGIAAAAAGFVLMNNILIIAGALVGASGIILTQIMCKGMNRSLSSVLFGAFGRNSYRSNCRCRRMCDDVGICSISGNYSRLRHGSRSSTALSARISRPTRSIGRGGQICHSPSCRADAGAHERVIGRGECALSPTL